MYSKILESLESKTVNELQEIRSCFEKVGETNCAWTTYAVKGIVLPDLQWILEVKKRKWKVKQMPKVILELPEMPESCIKCPCSWRMKDDIIICEAIMRYCPEDGRRPDCPLKLVERH